MTAPTESRLPPQTEEIIRSLRARLPELRRRYGITYLSLFGSYVRGEQKRRSDLDLLVEFDDRPLSLLGLVALERHLSSVAGVPVDLVEKQTLQPAIGRHILEEVIPV
jgi:uncharacterized protein